MRLLLVPPRYGSDLAGGAENLMRGFATRLASERVSIEVATTCATDHETWTNVLVPGRQQEQGVTVHRFEVDDRDSERHSRLVQRLTSGGALGYMEQIDLMATSVWSSALQRHLDRAGSDYDLLIFSPYLFGTTYWGVQSWPEKSVLVPCLHDEPYAHLACIRDMIEASAGCMFNSPAEERLARRLFRVPSGGLVGLGFDAPSGPADPTFAQRYGLDEYVVYVGRLEEGKGVDRAVMYTARYARERRPGVRLVLVGRGSYRVPKEHLDVVMTTGFLNDDEKRAALAGATALIQPSFMESLSIVLMEAWLEGTPALVAAQCEVTRDHAAHSGGGLPFASYEEFASALDVLFEDPARRRRMGERGAEYVLDVYGWPAVRARFDRFLTAAVPGAMPVV